MLILAVLDKKSHEDVVNIDGDFVRQLTVSPFPYQSDPKVRGVLENGGAGLRVLPANCFGVITLDAKMDSVTSSPSTSSGFTLSPLCGKVH